MNVPYEKYLVKRRFPELVKLKDYAVYFSKQHTIATEEELMDYFGYKNHSSICHIFKKMNNFLTWDKVVKREVKEINAIIQLKGLANNNKVNLNDFYYINMNDFVSVRTNSEKSAIFVGYTDAEIQKMLKSLKDGSDEIKLVKHTKTHKFIIEKLK